MHQYNYTGIHKKVSINQFKTNIKKMFSQNIGMTWGHDSHFSSSSSSSIRSSSDSSGRGGDR